jgi:hypothetical protein
MKKLSIVIALLNCFIITIAQAQKLPDLPNLQTVSLRAPAGIKVNGKAGEWGNKMQAYNKATEIYYTLSNDDEKLYLTVQAKYHDVVDKIIRGGLTFTINHTVKKFDKEHVAVTYPVLRGEVMAEVANNYARKSNQQRDANGAAIAVDDINQLFESRSKRINVEGFKDIAGADISVYNEEGIRAAAMFDGNVVCTYELAIPLKYLNLPNNGADAFAYHIKLNEPAEMDVKPVSHSAPPPPMMTTQLSPTDFWGEYTLAKK